MHVMIIRDKALGKGIRCLLIMRKTWLLHIKKLEEILQKAVTPKTAAVFLTIVYVVSLIPLFLIARYNYPSADDYGISATCRQVWVDTHSLFPVIGQAVLMAWYDYINWMGYFTSIFLMALHPGVFGEQFYFLTTWIMVGMISFSTIYLLRAILVKGFGADKYISHCISIIVLFISIQCMIGRVEALYWFCGAVNYIVLHGMSLFFFGTLISSVYDKGKKRVWDLTLASVLGFLTGGGNQMTALNVAVVLAAAIILITYRRGWKAKKAISIPMGLFFLGFLLNIAAPGNWVRAGGIAGMNPVKAVFVSFYYCLDYAMGEWTGWPVILMILMLIPLFWHMAGRVVFTFPYPAAAVLFGFCLVSAIITPPLFAVGNIEAGRLQALMYLMYVLVLSLSVGYVTGWARKHIGKMGEKAEAEVSDSRFSLTSIWCLLSCLFFFAFASVLTVIPEPHYFTFTSAITDLSNGSAKAYGEVLRERTEIYNNGSRGILEVEPLPAQPKLLYFDDITEDAQDWKNRGLARYYEIEGVIVKTNVN